MNEYPQYAKSNKLSDVCYDIRGPVMVEAKRLEEEGYQVLKLNIGNPAAFGFDTPDEMCHDVIINLRSAQGYCDSKGLFAARKAVVQHYQRCGVLGVDIENVYIGNGVSELIQMSMQALLNDGDEVLIPAPDYPLWTAAVRLAGGTPVHYRCDEQAEWYPDLDDMRAKASERTRAVVVINPNNPTGAVYPRDLLQQIYRLAVEHNLMVCADEIYEKILYDGVEHTPMASLGDEVFCLSFNGLSKAYRAAGFRAGWLMLSGAMRGVSDYREGLDILANMRLCSNVPAQFAIQTALGGYQSIDDLVLPGGRLREQRDRAYEGVTAIPGVSCVKPKGALYLFPHLDPARFNVTDDQQFVLDFLLEKRVLIVQGTGFNCPDTNHFRIVFLPDVDTLQETTDRLADFLARYKQ